MSSYLSGSLSVTNSTAGSYSKNKLAVKSLPEGPSIPPRRCPRGQLGGGGGSGSCSSLSPPCKMYGGRYRAAETGLPRTAQIHAKLKRTPTQLNPSDFTVW